MDSFQALMDRNELEFAAEIGGFSRRGTLVVAPLLH